MVGQLYRLAGSSPQGPAPFAGGTPHIWLPCLVYQLLHLVYRLHQSDYRLRQTDRARLVVNRARRVRVLRTAKKICRKLVQNCRFPHSDGAEAGGRGAGHAVPIWVGWPGPAKIPDVAGRSGHVAGVLVFVMTVDGDRHPVGTHAGAEIVASSRNRLIVRTLVLLDSVCHFAVQALRLQAACHAALVAATVSPGVANLCRGAAERSPRVG
jgi:hypothetical protein